MQLNQHSVLKLVICSLAIGSCVASTAIAQEQPPPPPPPQQGEVPKIIRKSGGVLQGSATRRVEPAYPPLAKAARVSGAVVVEVTIDEEGNVMSARAISGHPLLKDAAIAAAQVWTFAPTELSGVRVKVIGTITFNFLLPYSKELEWLIERARANPDFADLQYDLGRQYIAENYYEKGLAALKRAINLNPDFGLAYFEIGRANEVLNRPREAFEAFKSAVSIRTDFEGAASALIFVGTYYLAEEKTQEAIEAFKRAVTISPDSTEAHFALGRAYLQLGDRKSAMEEYYILRALDEQTAKKLLKLIKYGD
jgi:TonB family protein